MLSQKKIGVFLLFLAFMGASHGFRNAQGQAGPGGNLWETSYKQDFNTYTWNLRLNYRFSAGKKTYLKIGGLFSSDLLRATQQTNKWKDDEKLDAEYLYRISDRLLPFFYFQYQSFADRQTGFRNDYRTQLAGAGLRIQTEGYGSFSLLSGWKEDRRYGRKDRGLHFRLESFAPELKFYDYQTEFLGRWEGDHFKNRRDRNFGLLLRVKRTFWGRTTDSLRVQVNRLRRTYYISEEGDLETRLERHYDLFNHLQYDLGNGWLLHVRGQLYTKKSVVEQQIARKSTGQRERTDAGFQWQMGTEANTRHGVFSLVWQVNSETQTFYSSKELRQTPFMGSLGVPNSDSKTYVLRGDARFRIGRTDSLRLFFTVSRFRYDTPDSNNFDDRDEFRLNAGMAFRKQVGPLKATTGIRTNLHHLVYLYAQKSANNNWNRILHLFIDLNYRPSSGFRWSQHASVLANYTSYDFEASGFQIRSFVFRKMTLADSLGWQFSSRWQFLAYHRIELEENGRLYWEDFSAQLLLTRRNHSFALGLEYRLTGQFTGYIGFTGYLRREWRYVPLRGEMQKKFYGDFVSLGPVIRIRLYTRGQKDAVLSYSDLNVTTPTGHRYTIRRIRLQASWLF